MKKVCFIIRDGYDARVIISKLQERNIDAELTYIIESGSVPRHRKLNRMIRNQGLFASIINIFALLVYNHVMLKQMRTICGYKEYPKECEYSYINDVNDDACISVIQKKGPDMILTYGTGILKSDTIKKLGKNIYNIHSSILPYYRNVHSDFWAYMDNRKDLIGVTIFKLDAGIDTGDIALQRSCKLEGMHRLYEYKAENLKNIPDMVNEFLQKFFCGEIYPMPQEQAIATIAKTPEFSDIIRFFREEKKLV